jgi:hypothetical protein
MGVIKCNIHGRSQIVFLKKDLKQILQTKDKTPKTIFKIIILEAGTEIIYFSGTTEDFEIFEEVNTMPHCMECFYKYIDDGNIKVVDFKIEN